VTYTAVTITPPVHPIRRVLGGVVNGLLFLIAPAMIVVAVVVDGIPTSSRWIMAAAGVGITVFTAMFDRSVARANTLARRRTERLNEVGVPAKAEILESKSISLGENNGVALTLRVTGEGFAPFEAIYECEAHPSLRTGAELSAVVDPTDRLYAVTS
jgi:hypothetical protein